MSCTASELQRGINEFIGGSLGRTRHPLNPQFIYSEGVEEVAELAGAYWLLDWVALKLAPVYAQAWMAGECSIGIITLNVRSGEPRRASIELSLRDDGPPAVVEEVRATDFPEGCWKFYLGTDEIGDDQYVTTMILPQEY